jgi:hypothetical protein
VLKCFSELQKLDINIDEIIRREEEWWARRLKRLLKILPNISLKNTVQERKYRNRIIHNYFPRIISEADLSDFALLLRRDCFKELRDEEIERIFRAGNPIDAQKLLSYEDFYDLVEPLVMLLSRPVLKQFSFTESYKNAIIEKILNYYTQDYQNIKNLKIYLLRS